LRARDSGSQLVSWSVSTIETSAAHVVARNLMRSNKSLDASGGSVFSQLTWCGEGCFDSRRRVNSNVVRPTPSLGMKPVASVLMLFFVTVATFTKPPDVIWRKFEELTKMSPQQNKEKLDALAV